MESTLQERIQIVVSDLSYLEVDQVGLANVAGVTKGTVNQWLSGAIKSMKLEYALRIEKKFGYNHRWLVMGERPKLISELHSDKDHVEQPLAHYRVEIWPFKSIPKEHYDSLTEKHKSELEIFVARQIDLYLAAQNHTKSVRKKAG
jgi:transcriptional regulator with XRE-family HTH domain